MKKLFLVVMLSVSLVAQQSQAALVFFPTVLGIYSLTGKKEAQTAKNMVHRVTRPGNVAKISVMLVIACIFALPVCLLDNKGEDVSVSKDDLLANGYSNIEVDQILADHDQLLKLSDEKQRPVFFEEGSKFDTVKQMIRSVSPTSSDVYLEFVRDTYGLK